MNHAINVALVIIGIVCLTVPPLGLTILALAFLSHRYNVSRQKGRRAAMLAVRAQQERRARILAFKSLP